MLVNDTLKLFVKPMAYCHFRFPKGEYACQSEKMLLMVQ